MREIIEDTSSPRYNLAKWFSLVAKMLAFSSVSKGQEKERNLLFGDGNATYFKIFNEFKETKSENFLISFGSKISSTNWKDCFQEMFIVG